jgi:hypothetical protein
MLLDDMPWEAHQWQLGRFDLQARERGDACSTADNQPGTPTCSISPASGNKHTASNKMLGCQVEGCTASPGTFQSYHQRYRICEPHLKAIAVVREGVEQRFCQQCGRFQLLSEFDGDKRSCRARLDKHNARRRRMREIQLMLRTTGVVDEALLLEKYGAYEEEAAGRAGGVVKTSGSAVSKRDKAGKRGGGSSSRKKSMPRAQHAKPSGARTPGGGRPLAMVPKLDSGSSGEDAGSAHVVGGREALGMPSISSAALLMDARPDLTLFADDYLDEVRNALGG